ncbi:hypothetical protein [Nonomuraea dietziae]|uniref:hypothetical protein n=1 Tax=Nonomuraea dietziae TaxID=65515 RepID=UPI0031CEC938
MAAQGESFVWTVAASPDGRSVYAGTSPNGKLVRYDTATGQITDLGSPVPGEQYLRDLAVAEDGTVYAGVGAQNMKVAVIGQDGTTLRVIDPPIEGHGYAYDVDVIGRHLLVRFSTSTNTNPMGRLRPGDRRLEGRRGGRRQPHRRRRQTRPPGPPLPERGARRLRPEVGPGRHQDRVHRLRRRARPGPSAGSANTLVGTGSTGRIWRYDRRSGKGELLEGTLTGQPVSVRSMAVGPDGRV